MAHELLRSVPIADLSPNLTDTDDLKVLGIVTLIWPYSSATKTLSLLLVEPDFRLRARCGQVRLCFHGASAKAISNAEIASGDRLSLSLKGVAWGKDDSTASTPGKGIEWKLRYGESVDIKIQQDSGNTIPVFVDHPLPSPEATTENFSPSRSPTFNSHIPVSQRKSRVQLLNDGEAWSSPAFLKRSHFLTSSYDPLRDDDDFPDNERRKKTKFGRGSGQWRFTEKAPSPVKETVYTRMEIETPTKKHFEQGNAVEADTAVERVASLTAPAAHEIFSAAETELAEPSETFETTIEEFEASKGPDQASTPLVRQEKAQADELTPSRKELEPPLVPAQADADSESQLVRKDGDEVLVKTHSPRAIHEEAGKGSTPGSELSIGKPESVSSSSEESDLGKSSEPSALESVAPGEPSPEPGVSASLLSGLNQGSIQPAMGEHLRLQGIEAAKSATGHPLTVDSAVLQVIDGPGHGATTHQTETVSEDHMAVNYGFVSETIRISPSSRPEIEPDYPEKETPPQIGRVPVEHEPSPQRGNLNTRDMLQADRYVHQDPPKSPLQIDVDDELTPNVEREKIQRKFDTPSPTMDEQDHLPRSLPAQVSSSAVEVIDLDSEVDEEEQRAPDDVQRDVEPLAITPLENNVLASRQLEQDQVDDDFEDAMPAFREEQEVDDATKVTQQDLSQQQRQDKQLSLPQTLDERDDRGASIGQIREPDGEAPNKVDAERQQDAAVVEQLPPRIKEDGVQFLIEPPSTIPDSMAPQSSEQLPTPSTTQRTSFISQPSTVSLQSIPDQETLPSPRLTQEQILDVQHLQSSVVPGSQEPAKPAEEPRKDTEASLRPAGEGITDQRHLQSPDVPEKEKSADLSDKVSEKNKPPQEPQASEKPMSSPPPFSPITPVKQKSKLIERLKAMRRTSQNSPRTRLSNSTAMSSPWFAPRHSSQTVPDSEAESVISEVEKTTTKKQSSGFLPQKPVSLFVTPEKPLSEAFVRSSPGEIDPASPASTQYVPPSQPAHGGIRTKHSYFVPMSELPAHFGVKTDTLALAIASTSITRCSGGRKDYTQSIYITDGSMPDIPEKHPLITAQIFRPNQTCFPQAQPGDSLLLRDFKVQFFQKRMSLLSTDTSAWAVFHKGAEPQIRGPPLEFGPEERGYARVHWDWWAQRSAAEKERLKAAVPAEKPRQSPPVIVNGTAKVKVKKEGINGVGVELPGSQGSPRSAGGKKADLWSTQALAKEWATGLAGSREPEESEDDDQPTITRRALRPRNGRGKTRSTSPEKGPPARKGRATRRGQSAEKEESESEVDQRRKVQVDRGRRVEIEESESDVQARAPKRGGLRANRLKDGRKYTR